MASLTSTAAPSETKQTVICVFCAASSGNPAYDNIHLQAATKLAHVLHENKISLVYGGGTTGLMGTVARTLVSLSGPGAVHGVIPRALIKSERKGQETVEYGRTTIVEDMHTRKKMMAQDVMNGGPGSGFIALSGGYGTMEELMEMVTWNQLGIHDRGIVVLNVDGYYDGLIAWVNTATKSGFVRDNSSDRIMVEAKTAEEAVKALQEYKVSKGRFDLTWEKS